MTHIVNRMISADFFNEMALSFPGTESKPHFDRVGYKVIGRRMFATYLESNNSANIFLTPEEQLVFCKMDAENIYPVPNKWGEKGATTFILNQVAEGIVLEALSSAYQEIKRGKKN